MVPAIRMAAADLHTVHGIRHGELIVYVVLGKGRILVADVGLVPYVIAADVDIAGLADRQIKFKSADSQVQGIFGQLNQSANVMEFQIAIAQATGRVVTCHAEVFVHPECDVAAEISGGKETEQPGTEVRLGDEWRHAAGRDQRIKIAAIAGGLLEKRVHPKTDGRKPGNASRPDRVWKKFLLRRRTQQRVWDFQKAGIIGGELKTCVLKCLPEVVQFGKV